MSKQLLHSHNSDVIVAALNHRAFAVSVGKNAVVYELMAQTSSTGDDVKTNDGNEIQAVCCAEIGSSLWFAASRGVKTLSLYSIPAEKSVEEGAEETTKLLYPCAIYNLPKRARSLAFTNVDDLQLIVAGDLSGDAIAFQLPTDSPISTSNENTEMKQVSTPKRLLLGHTASMLTGLNVVKGNDHQRFILTADRDEKVRVSCFPETHIIHGYLLGHSSFISCMDAISNERSFCLTAGGDGTSRLWDYKTCKEVGMLPLVIKKSVEEKQVDMEEVENEDECKSSPEESDGMDNDADDVEGDEFDEEFDGDDDDEGESFDEHTVAVPLSVALHPDAKFAAVARDETKSIDVHPIASVEEKSTLSTSFQLSNFVSLHKKQTLECNSQPLAVRFTSDSSVLVLATEPEYILHFSTCDGTTFNDISESSLLSRALRKVAQSEKITMPPTTLERDGQGECKLQKREDRKELTSKQNADKGGHHWNDSGRKVTAKKAQARKRQRRMERKKEEKNNPTAEAANEVN